MAEQLKNRIADKLLKIIDKCSDSELLVSSAYYVPSPKELEIFLSQNDNIDKIDILIKENISPFAKAIVDEETRKKFCNIIKGCIVYKANDIDEAKKELIRNKIKEFLNIVKNENIASEKSRIDIEKVVTLLSNLRGNKIKSGFENALKPLFSKLNKIDSSNKLEEYEEKLKQELEKICIYKTIDLQLYSIEKRRELLNNLLANNNYLSDAVSQLESSGIPNKELVKRALVINTIYSIMYQSASHPCAIEVHKDPINNHSFVRVNSEILPLSLYTEILDDLNKNNTKAFENINMYLSGSEITFFDNIFRKYILSLDDTHIVGIKKTESFIEDIMQYYKKIKECQNDSTQSEIDKKITIIELQNQPIVKLLESIKKKQLTLVKKPKFIFGISRFVSGPYLIEKNPLFKVYTLLGKLNENPATSEKEIIEQINAVNEVQESITSIMTNQSTSKILERLIYLIFINKINYNSEELANLNNIDAENLIKSFNLDNTIEEINLDEIIEKNIYVLGNEFLKEYTSNKELIIKMLKSISSKKTSKILKQYIEIMKVQNYLNYKYKELSIAILDHIDVDSWEKYFASRHDLEGKLKPNTIGAFGLAQMMIDQEITEHKKTIELGNNIDQSIFNLFKVHDKTYYLTNFNYITDIKRIYISEDGKDIICEMEALEENLVAYFEYFIANNIAKFYSVQNREYVPIYTSSTSQFEDIFSFENKEYSTIIAFKDKDSDSRITQNYPTAKGKIITANDFISKLKNGDICLSTLTSLEVKGDYEQDEKILSRLWGRTKQKGVINSKEQNELTLIGCSNAMEMIQNLDAQLLKEFAGIKVKNTIELSYIQNCLALQNIQKLVENLEIRKNYVTDQETINKISNRINEFQLIKQLIETILNPSEVDTLTKIERIFNEHPEIQKIEYLYILELLAYKIHQLNPQTEEEKNKANSIYQKIKLKCFTLEVERITANFAEEMPQLTEEYKQITGYFLSKDEHPIPVKFSSGRSERLKDGIFSTAAGILTEAKRIIATKYSQDQSIQKKYLEIVEQKLSTIINSTGVFTYTTTFEKKATQFLEQEEYKQFILDQSYLLHTDMKNVLHHQLGNGLVKGGLLIAIIDEQNRKVEARIKELEERYKTLYSEYHFEDNVIPQQEEIMKQVYHFKDKHFSYDALTDFILNEYRETILFLNQNFLKYEGVIKNDNGTASKNETNLVKRREQYTTRIREITNTYMEIISKLHRIYIEINATVHSLEKDNINELIKEKFQQVIKQTQNQNIPFLYTITAAQIQQMTDSINPQSGLKM